MGHTKGLEACTRSACSVCTGFISAGIHLTCSKGRRRRYAHGRGKSTRPQPKRLPVLVRLTRLMQAYTAHTDGRDFTSEQLQRVVMTPAHPKWKGITVEKYPTYHKSSGALQNIAAQCVKLETPVHNRLPEVTVKEDHVHSP